MIVEPATIDDLPRVVELCLDGAKEFDFSGMWPPEPLQVAEYVHEQWVKAPCFVIRHNGEIVGFSGLIIDAHWWSTKPVLMDYRTYILPCHRNYNVIKKLYDAIKHFADLQGLPVFISHMAQTRLDARRRLMRRLGFSEIGFMISYDGGQACQVAEKGEAK